MVLGVCTREIAMNAPSVGLTLNRYFRSAKREPREPVTAASRRSESDVYSTANPKPLKNTGKVEKL